MKAIVKQNDAIGMAMETRQKPEPKANEVLIKIHKTSICGTDINIYKWGEWAKKNVPLGTIIGHEFVGHIVELGSDVTDWKVGDRVSAEGHITCGKCRSCRNGFRHLCPKTKVFGIHQTGCFAEYFTVPAENLFYVPETISDGLAAIFDPLGNAVHTALSFDLVGKDILITGAGPIGAMAASVAKQCGARHIVITDINDKRLKLASQLGATKTVNVSKENIKDVLNELQIPDGFNVGLEMSGAESALQTLTEALAPGGKIALLGILPQGASIDWDLVIFKMLEIKGIFGREIFNTWHQMSHLLESGMNIEPIITHRYPAEEFQNAFDAMLSGDSGKVILEWS